MTYVVQSDLEDRLTSEVVRQILDDDVDEVVDTSVLARVIEDAESYVESFLRGVYSLTVLRAQGTSCPTEVKRIVLDIATAYMWQRHPEYVRADGESILRRVRAELMDIRKGITRLNIEDSPEPAANQGGVAQSGDPLDTEVKDKYFLDGIGDF